MTEDVAVMSVSGVIDSLEAELGEIEKAIRAEIGSHNRPELDYICEVKGKRLRPALVILTTRLGDPDWEDMVNSAVGVEFLHVATLVHDDVIDRSDLRRGQPSAQKRFGVDRAIVMGDYYLAKGLQCLSRLGHTVLAGDAAEAVMTICKGELTSVSLDQEAGVAQAAYFEKIKAKTSALLEVCTAAGAVSGNLGPEQILELNTYARELGIAFQIVDDLLDYVGDEVTLGKPTGSDLREGTVTLPLLRALAGDQGQELQTLVGKQVLDDADIERCVQLVRASSTLPEVWREAQEHAERAIASLSSFAPGASRESLERLCEAVVAKR